MHYPVIVPASRENYTELIRLWEKSVRATHHFLKEADIQYYKPLILNEYFDQVELFCLKEGDRIAGFIGIDEQLIQMLFVDPERRGEGIGRALINYARGRFGVNSVDVNEQNQEAVAFYRHLGFVSIARFDQDAAGKAYPILNMVLH